MLYPAASIALIRPYIIILIILQTECACGVYGAESRANIVRKAARHCLLDFKMVQDETHSRAGNLLTPPGSQNDISNYLPHAHSNAMGPGTSLEGQPSRRYRRSGVGGWTTESVLLITHRTDEKL